MSVTQVLLKDVSTGSIINMMYDNEELPEVRQAILDYLAEERHFKCLVSSDSPDLHSERCRNR